LARQLLESGGYSVVGEAGDAGGALRAHAALRPEIVLLDIQLPGQDGFAVAESLAADADPPIVVLISSRDRAAYRRRPQRQPPFLPKGELTLTAFDQAMNSMCAGSARSGVAPDVEAATNFLCVEALTNVAKYARATATRVSIEVADQILAVEVADNGIGGADPAKVLGYSDFKIVWMCSAGCLPWRVPRAAPACPALSPWNARRSSGPKTRQAVSSTSATARKSGRTDGLVEGLRQKAKMLGSGTMRVHDLHAGFTRLPKAQIR
jgi:DNA-binding NarL/FixJ family response regulator